ncbi:MAG TPA: hypothetical protein VK463_02610 [Desulfomonilaceae bacterium]|nr:hypothetical protein [Desulfomonilaceae bacterium]
MKKSLVLMTVIVATLAFAGMVCAQSCLPPVCDLVCKAPGLEKFQPIWKHTKLVPYPGPKCTPCGITPGGPYANVPRLANREYVKTVDVMKDLCVGQAKGKTKLCGPCAPTIAWSGKWKTAMICGKVDVSVVLPPAYALETGEYDYAPTGVKCGPKPCPPPECF